MSTNTLNRHYTRCGLNADWCNEAWFVAGTCNAGLGLYLFDLEEDPEASIAAILRDFEADTNGAEIARFTSPEEAHRAVTIARRFLELLTPDERAHARIAVSTALAIEGTQFQANERSDIAFEALHEVIDPNDLLVEAGCPEPDGTVYHVEFANSVIALIDGLLAIPPRGPAADDPRVIIADLVAWATAMGGWEAPCWSRARAYLEYQKHST